MNILYLASKSTSRKKLLQRAGIHFEIIEQDANEQECDWNLELQKVVENIAIHKMNHVIMPQGQEGQIAFVLTADTLSFDTHGTIRGKPTDLQDAITMLKQACGPNNKCGTAFCLDKKIVKNGIWQTQKRITHYAHAIYDFNIPHDYIEKYIRDTGAMEGAGAFKIEEGSQFVKSISGSYSAIVGLPMFELWQALHEIGFFNKTLT